MDLVQKAITASLSRDWKQAIDLNLQILKNEPKDLDALNRLGRAYFESGHKSKAEEIYKKVLKIDKFNTIALRNLELLKTSRLPRSAQSPLSSSPPPIFLEEPGLTKTVHLIRPGDPKITSRLHPGDAVNLAAREHCVNVISQDGSYLGRLPDDITSRLRPLIKAGNVYHAWLRTIDPLRIFIKEISRVTKFRHTPSFPITEKLTYAAFTPPELVHDEKPEITSPESENEDYSPAPGDLEDGPEPEPSSDF